MSTLNDLAKRLGCPPAICPDRELQTAELHQWAKFTDHYDIWWAGGYHEVSGPPLPTLMLRYVHGVNVVTFAQDTNGQNFLWPRIPNALDQLSECAAKDLYDDETLSISGKTYPAYYALMDVSELKVVVDHERVSEIAAFASHFPESHRTVVLYGVPDEIRKTRLEWLATG